MEPLARLLQPLLGPPREESSLPLVDVRRWLGGSPSSEAEALAQLNAAFLLALAGADEAECRQAEQVLDAPPALAPEESAEYYRLALEAIRHELAEAEQHDPGTAQRLRASARALEQADGTTPPLAVAEAAWAALFPEGVGILGHEDERISDLRERRTVSLTELNRQPISDPARQVLFTSNVLLTVPAAGADIDTLPFPADLRAALRRAAGEPQLYWYDHPIQIGVAPVANELLYGLRGLDQAVAFEQQRNPPTGRARVCLSLSVTHAGLREVAHDYARDQLARDGGLRHLDVFLFTEDDTCRLVDEVLAPIAGREQAEALVEVFGVDGEYGRHYSFLKAIAALWQVLVEPDVRATFKIDLDQVFPQRELVEQSGASAFEHLRTPLWGARGLSAAGEELELGMLAGALVNERDIGRGLFTPDVDFPSGPSAPDEFVFFSRLPQALSTRAEMMERYAAPPRDGHSACLERVHVTGGTNGIMLDALRRQRPYTPSFIGRAEDQAYLLSVLGPGDSPPAQPRLAYAHAAGLIMRHDKEAFAAQAIEAARVGKLVGDDVRILFFSAYAELLGRERVKALLDPFTGCFISRLPLAVVGLRFALRVAHAFARGDERLALDLAESGAPRLARAMASTRYGTHFQTRILRERAAWGVFYETLEAIEQGLSEGRPEMLDLRETARRLVGATQVS